MPPTSPLSASWVGAPTYRGPSRVILGTWVTPTQWIYQPAGAAGSVGAPTIIAQQLVVAGAGGQTRWGTAFALTKVFFYRPPQYSIAASWVGKPAYSRNVGASLSVTWDRARFYANPPGFLSEATGTPFVTQQQFVRPPGFTPLAFGDTYAIFPYQYAPPRWTINGSWVGKPAYTPAMGVRDGLWTLPSEDKFIPLTGWDASNVGAATVHNFLSILAPAGADGSGIGAHRLQNAAAALRPGGIASQLAFGASMVAFGSRGLVPIGVDQSAIGAAAVVLKNRRLFPGGFAAGAAGDPTIINRNRYVAAGNIGAPALPGAVVYLYTRYLLPGGILATAFPATNRVSHGRQYVLQGSGIGAPPVGTAWISYGTRVLEPAGAFLDAVGRPTVGGTRFLQLGGWDAAAFGTRIIPESRTVAPLGFREVWGQTDVKNHLTYARPVGFQTTVQEQFRWGQARAFNLRQIVAQVYDPNDGLNPPPWSQWTLIENRNRPVGAIGIQPGRVGEPQVDNNARLVAPAGMTPPGFPGTAKAHLVAYGVRFLPLQGLEPVPMSNWAAVFNAARAVAPGGAAAQAFGAATLENTRRYFDRIGDIDSAAVGTAFVDFAIRAVAVEPRYSIPAPELPLPEVKLQRRYLDAIGAELQRFGTPALSIHFNILAPKWAHRDLIGEPWIFNVTPEVRAFGHDSQDYGDAFVRLQWRPLAPAGTSMQVFGQARIADRTQHIAVPGNNFMRVGDKLVVTKTGAPPYSQQLIIVDPWLEPLSHVGKPGLNQYVLYPQSWDSMRFGEAFVREMSIHVDTGIKVDDYGRPTVALKKRFVTVQEWPGDEVFEPAPARVSPHTIWAVVEAPEQAKRNHGASGLHYVGQTIEYGPGARFGRAWIYTRRDRIDRATAGVSDGYGAARVQLRRRYIEPESIRAFRMGVASVGDGRQLVTQFGASNTMALGVPSLARAPQLHRQLTAAGVAPPAVPVTHWASLLHRQLPLPGFQSLAMGSSRGEPPYQWQSLHVGPPMPTIPSGIVPGPFGQTWVSLRVRELQAPGFDAFRCEYDPDRFAQRLRVRNATTPTPPTRTVRPVGFAFEAAGVPNARPGVHYIRPDGNADQYRKGAF